MFRSRALAKLQSPEKLDEPQRLIRRRSRGAVATVLVCIVFGLVWSVIGSVPEEGRGQGILLTPGAVRPVQVPTTGQLVHWSVREGDTVAEGQVLGLIEQVQIAQQIALDRDRLRELQERNRVLGELRSQYSQSQRESIATRRETLAEQIAYLERYIQRTAKLASQTRTRNQQALDQQKRNLEQSQEAAVEVERALHKRLMSYRRLHAETLISTDQLRDVRRDHEDARTKLDELALRLQEIQLKTIELEESHLNTQRLISTRESRLTDLKLQRRDLDIAIAQLDKADSESRFRDEQQVRDVERTISRTEKRLSIDREIRSDHAGRVVELSAVEGQFMTRGQRVALIDTRRDGDNLVALAYFKPEHGKRLSPGSAVRVSPSTIDRNKHGGIIGRVQSVSDYPVTLESAATQVGNETLARQLTAGGFTIEAVVELVPSPDNPSGYLWTSEQGPDVQLSAGTAAEVWCTVEQRRPISYVAPKLKDWLG
ncbi:MAG: NHLP bacteriocin system secretion protein, partial [Myxococcota bacterium]